MQDLKKRPYNHILVTGGAGYIGSVLVQRLMEVGYKVTVVDNLTFGNNIEHLTGVTLYERDALDLDPEWLNNVDAVIHLASVANDPCCELNPKLTWEISALATMQLIEQALRHNAKQFIYASSGSVYGVNDAEKVTEELELNPISDYNKTKMVTERVLLSYQDQIGIQIVRPATVCGPSPRMRLDVSVNMMTMQALTNKMMTVFGGDQVRPNIHIDDITDLYLFLLEHKNITGIYNAGFENLSILAIAQLVQKYVKADIKITPSNDPRSYRLCADKLLKTDFRPKKTVENAIQEMVAQFQSGFLKNEERFYNLKTMKNTGVGV